MSIALKEAKRRYRSMMGHHAKTAKIDRDACTEKAFSFLKALDDARLDIQSVSWLGRPVVTLNNGFLVQNLPTGTIDVHARVAAHGSTGGMHHKARRARTPGDALRLLKGPVARQTEIARMLVREERQEGVDKTSLYVSAMDQIALGDLDPDAAERAEDGLDLLRILSDKGICVYAVTVDMDAVGLKLIDGSISQLRDGRYRIGYMERNGDRRSDYRLQIDPVATPHEAVRVYLEQAVAMTVQRDAERRRVRDERKAARDAEERRQADVIARYEALPADTKAAAGIVVDYLEIAMRRTAGPLGLFMIPRRESGRQMLERMEREGMPPFEAVQPAMSLSGHLSDVFADADNDEDAGRARDAAAGA